MLCYAWKRPSDRADVELNWVPDSEDGGAVDLLLLSALKVSVRLGSEWLVFGLLGAQDFLQEGFGDAPCVMPSRTGIGGFVFIYVWYIYT